MAARLHASSSSEATLRRRTAAASTGQCVRGRQRHRLVSGRIMVCASQRIRLRLNSNRGAFASTSGSSRFPIFTGTGHRHWVYADKSTKFSTVVCRSRTPSKHDTPQPAPHEGEGAQIGAATFKIVALSDLQRVVEAHIVPTHRSAWSEVSAVDPDIPAAMHDCEIPDI
jgi:hypothetical protein